MVKVEKFLLFLLQGIPESSGVIALSLALAKVPLRWGRIIAAGTVIAVIAFCIRTSSFAAGLHTVAILLLNVIIMTIATRIPPTKAFVVALISSIILAFLELIINEILLSLLKFELQQVIENDMLWTLLGLPQAVMIIFIALLTARLMTPREDMWKI
ncbi:hypothetical protein [Pelotomaculum propionicicum]|uniref:hypothetical protein n=1 Tax=Pelotomaculum propionicicum TaxID=258475 RepID=UPI001065CD36|nr:hypothetical protein [Pelotomaculum propionicicum]NLI12282.1 hypothetical protein [Peptococcaceae bacterium]